MPSLTDLPHLIKLLDDEQPEVRALVEKNITAFGGDLSSHIANLGLDVSPANRARLSRLLRPQRREALRAEWDVPAQGLLGPFPDWDRFEGLQRLISDYLHDGVALRAPLPDALDMLAAEVEDACPSPTADDLREYLFETGRFLGNSKDYYAHQNSDLTWVLENQTGNPLGLSTIFILVGRRLGLEIGACNYPGHFLARIEEFGEDNLVDCFNKGRLINVAELLDTNELSSDARQAILFPCSPGIILKRTLVNLAHSFAKLNEEEDELLVLELASSLEKVATAK